MNYFKQNKSTIILRAAPELDSVLEAVALSERRTKTAVISLAFEQYAERHHPDLYKQRQESK